MRGGAIFHAEPQLVSVGPGIWVVEDHNEPGNTTANDGADVDRYFINVFTDPTNPIGTSRLVFDEDNDESFPTKTVNLEIDTYLKGKTKSQLIKLIHELAGKFPKIAQE